MNLIKKFFSIRKFFGKRRYIQLALTTVFALSLFSACSSKKSASESGAESGSGAPVTEQEVNNDLADSDAGKAMGIETIYFPYDSSVLDSTAKTTLKSNAHIMKENPSLRIQVEGHCDERGGIQYNIALGERRAKAVRAYMQDMGVQPNRLTIISYGKEKPLDPGHDEAAFAKNRRANFRVTEK